MGEPGGEEAPELAQGMMWFWREQEHFLLLHPEATPRDRQVWQALIPSGIFDPGLAVA